MTIMTNSDILISWIIIGRDWTDNLIDSLNEQSFNPDIIELIIIDDASSNHSTDHLENIQFKNKKIIKLDQQSGRCVARNAGIKIATGKYCLFTNSNTMPKGNFIKKYIDVLSDSDRDGFAGVIHYDSEDVTFEKYLNNNKRGLKKYCLNDVLPIAYVLFGNCAIKTSLINKVGGFNEKLYGYGGEEIDLLYRINHKHNLKIHKINTEVLRYGHPDFNTHCQRLIKFGSTNFKSLPFKIQKNIIPGSLLKICIILPVSALFYIGLYIKDNILGDSFFIMKAVMGLSILKGYKS